MANTFRRPFIEGLIYGLLYAAQSAGAVEAEPVTAKITLDA